MDIKKLIDKYKDMIPYLFFGVCTTIINLACYGLCAGTLSLSTVTSTAIAWLVAVIFAYVTNRKWVFHSIVTGFKPILKEMTAFFSARITTGIFDIIFMWITVDLCHANDFVMKIIDNVVVVILNYIFSKMLVFKKHE